jgi:hypothetical protein
MHGFRWERTGNTEQDWALYKGSKLLVILRYAGSQAPRSEWWNMHNALGKKIDSGLGIENMKRKAEIWALDEKDL